MIRLLLIGLLYPALLSADDEVRPPPASVPEEEDIHDDKQAFLYLARDRPVLIELHVRVDGRSFRANWHRFSDGMFRALDRNGDGLLTGAEWDGIPSPDFLIEGNPQGSAQGAELVRETIDKAPADGVVTREEFASYLLARGARALQLQPVQSDEARGRPQTGGAHPAAGNRLFSRMDVNRDGQLSAEELDQAARDIGRTDFDDDGALSVNELLFAPTNAPSRREAPQQNLVRTSPFVDFQSTDPFDVVGRRLLDQYDHPAEPTRRVRGSSGDDRLTRDEFPIAESAFVALDRDGDGELDFTELQEIGRHLPPGLVVTARIGRREEGISALEVAKVDAQLRANVRTTDDSHALLQFAGDELELAVEPTNADAEARDSLIEFFKRADRDGNSYLERSELPRTGIALLFDSLDEDGDGKLFANELFAYIARRESAAASRCLLAFSSDGRNLFDVFDVNHDGRLTRRELLQAAARWSAWDFNADSHLSPDEVPARYRLTFRKGRPELAGLPTVPAVRANPPGTPSRPGAGPAWFQRMDRNHDGEITRREFLGARALFDRYDRDQDGVIVEQEATAE